MLSLLYSALDYLIHALNFIAISILIIGIIKILIKYVATEFKSLASTHIRKIQKIRCELGVYILLALDILIVKDIIHTVTDLSLERLGELAILILIRTIIGYFIGKEVETLEKEGYIEI